MHVADGQIIQSQRISSGVHYASATRSRATDFDIGVGVIYEHSNATSNDAPADDPPVIETPDEHKLGGYLEFARRIWASPATRTWLGARAEVTRAFDTHLHSASLTGRLAWEAYIAGHGSSVQASANGYSTAMYGGSLGIGTYVESGVRRNGYGKAEFLVSAGLSVRMPGFLVFGFTHR